MNIAHTRTDYLGFKDDWNLILGTDSYKFGSHWYMLPNDTGNIYSYAEHRNGAQYDSTLFFGLQYILMKRLAGEIIQQWMIDEASMISTHHLGNPDAVNIDGFQTIVDEFGGRLPLEIRAVPEGTLVPQGNVLFTITSTDSKGRFAWLVNYVETILMKHWYPCTVATRSHYIVKFLREMVEKTSDWTDAWKFLLHDFGLRSTTCEEAGEIGGAAHLLNSMGTDTVTALKMLHKFYGAPYEGLGVSVPATEHSIENAYGGGEGEIRYVEAMLEKHPEGGIVSVVGDGQGGIEHFVTKVLPACKEKIFNWAEQATAPVTKFVVRPDSPRFDGDTAAKQCLWIHESLATTFGSSVNKKGYRTLAPCVGTIYGDGLEVPAGRDPHVFSGDPSDLYDIYLMLEDNKWCVDSQVVGQGGGLLQKLNRDTQRVAIKASAMERGESWKALRKTTQDPTKRSKSGHLALVKTQNGFETVPYLPVLGVDDGRPEEDMLRTVFRNGRMANIQNFAEIRKNTGLW